jgi:signal transduction histidine kinase
MRWPFGTIASRTSFGLPQFVLAAATTIAVAMGLLTFAISQRIEASMMQTAADEGALFSEFFLGPAAQSLATSRSLSPENIKRLDDLLAGTQGERMILVKIWLPDATLVYSSNKEAAGGQVPSRHITAAAAGNAIAEFDYPDEAENAGEKRLQAPLVEIYAPLFRLGAREVIAVGELYSDGRRLAADLNSIRLTSAGIVGAVTAPMMLILFLMVRRASNLVSKYQSSLLRNVAEATHLAAQNDRLRRVADDARLEAASSNESLLARIGRDLHDGPIQLVSLLMLKVTAPAEAGTSKVNGTRDPSIEALTGRILADLRSISTGLVLPELDGLAPNEILLLAVANHEDATGTRVSRQIDQLPEDLAVPIAICLYRIVQEGLNNAFHHGNAVAQFVTIQVQAKSIIISVKDRGPGLDNSRQNNPRGRRGLGLAGLRNRVEALKGTFEIISEHGIGTEIRATLPSTTQDEFAVDAATSLAPSGLPPVGGAAKRS